MVRLSCAGGQPVASLALAEPRRISRAKRPACRMAEAASGNQIDTVMKEKRVFPPPQQFAERAAFHDTLRAAGPGSGDEAEHLAADVRVLHGGHDAAGFLQFRR